MEQLQFLLIIGIIILLVFTFISGILLGIFGFKVLLFILAIIGVFTIVSFFVKMIKSL